MILLNDAFHEATADFDRVPVMDLHKDNIHLYVQQIKNAITDASFVALDCELSGLGDRKKINAPGIDDRYKNTGLVAKTRSIISIGLSTYALQTPSSTQSSNVKSWSYRVQSYNIMVLCGEDYIVEPGSLRFLVEHGFDFKKQYSLGVQYKRGNDRPADEDSNQILRQLFSHLVQAEKAIVLHNGLIDLVFLYHNLYAALPDKLGTFVSDLSEMFPGGIYDTKYIADYVCRTHASFLEFIFRKEQKTNQEKCSKNRPHVRVSFPVIPADEDVDWRHCGPAVHTKDSDKQEVCFSYAHHGHCSSGNTCSNSHDIDLIIRQRQIEKDKTRKRKHKETGNTDNIDSDNSVAPAQTVTSDESVPSKNGVDDKILAPPSKTSPANSGGHRAGFDAFMTGFAFCTFLVHQTQMPSCPADFSPASVRTQQLVNRVYLVCKDFPMLVQKSAFAKCSCEHDKKLKRLKAEQQQAGESTIEN